jgi:chorismate dehydratase
MALVRISAVKYINTYPFILGINESKVLSMIDLEVCHPSECAARLLTGRTDVGLMPVAVLSLMDEYHIIGDYCIGTRGEVKTVIVVGNTPPEDSKRIFLDYRSRSSNSLCQVIAKKFWKRSYEFVHAPEDFDVTTVKDGESAVIIGDRCFQYARDFKYHIDMGKEWNKYTGLPFVFAAWIAAKKQDENFTILFNEALAHGVQNKDRAVSLLSPNLHVTAEEVKDYYKNNIDFILDDPKREAMSLFIRYIKELNIQV